MRYTTLLFVLAVSLIFSSLLAQNPHCIADRYAQTPLFDSSEVSITEEVVYAVAERWPGTQIDSLIFDIYMPEPGLDPLDERPLILAIHGGSFLTGNHEEMATYCMEMARRGFVAATMEYRLGWNCPTTELLGICIQCGSEASKLKVATYRAAQDARAALRYLVHNAETYGIDNDAIFVAGGSAGAITAMHATFWDQSEADELCPTCTDILGPLDEGGNDLTDTYDIKGVVNDCGAIRDLDQLDGHDIPVIGFHDEWDCVVPVGGGNLLNCLGCTSFYWARGSNAIRARLNQNGVCSNMNLTPASLNHCSYPIDAVIGKSSCFLKSILCNDCETSYSTQTWDIPDCTDGTVVDGIEDLQLLDVNIWPNPSPGILHVELRSMVSEQLSLSVYGMEGRLEALFTLTGPESTQDLSELSSGLKYLEFEDGQGRRAVRLWSIEK